ncbi:ada2a-containing complex component 3 isoform X2 [Bombus vancouverensis nearcticus]|uniref:GA-binding protein subunit beta-1 isoform X2 n=1 Tax=Bombus bifarius TaxID=103933 RepID=A0A6P8MAC0_9HYME|nr:GA-binding protein subunit beta-1 isoform X2 [Bombus vancouverensis nearcticus]XP_033310686.1 GA-binding protein subunit beta-1 isoform X2 [Bombus bifarius]
MQAESICTNDIEGLDSDTLIPVEILSCDVSHRARSQDALSIVELGKQLLFSAKYGDTDSVRDLMCRGAPFTTDWLGTSALHFAAQNNHTETAEVLLRAGISRDARTKVDRTPLHMAAYEGHHQMTQLLLNYGADVDSRDMLKMTPLHWAVEREHVEVMHVLLEHGADANATSKFDKTPISLALEHDRLDLVDILQQEREIIGIRAHQQNQANSAELEVATHNLIQLESEREEEQQKFELPQQDSQQKKKITQVQMGKKPRMIFQQIHVGPNVDVDRDKEIEGVDEITDTNNINNSKKRKDITTIGGINKKFRLLEAHGITMIPVDNDSSIVENAMESGRTVVLTGMKRLHVAGKKGTPRKVIAIRADQILSHNTPTLTSRGPNILKRSSVDNKAGKLFISSISNTTPVSTLTQSKNLISPSESKIINSPAKMTEPIILQLDDDIEEIVEDDPTHNNEPVMDIALLNRQLAEARRQAAEYRKRLQKKEEEAEIYKQQLKTITAQRASK